MSEYKYLELQREGSVLVCTINNPPKNFLNAQIVPELFRMADEAEADESVRALVITGGVEGIFITHYDVGELVAAAGIAREHPSFGAGDEPHQFQQTLLKFRASRMPVIAAINGTAMGGGCELALGCDFRYMARGARLGLPEVRIGLLPGGGGTQRMARLLGTAKALELMLLGNTLDADTAERVGLVHRAVNPECLMDDVMMLAKELASRPPLSIALIKQCVHEGSEMPLEDGLRLEQQAFWKTMRSEDADRLMRAYLESESPLDQQ